MKIVIINKHIQDTTGGSELQCDLIAEGLRKLGHHVTYLAIGRAETYDTHYDVIPVSRKPEDISHAVIGVNPDVVYWRYNKHNLRSTLQPIYRRGIPVVFGVSHIHDTRKWGVKGKYSQYSPLKRVLIRFRESIRNRLNFRGFQYINGVVVNNRAFLNRLPVRRQVFIPSSAVTKTESFEWSRPYFLWAGSLKPSKRPELCIEVANKIGTDILMMGPVQKSRYEHFQNERNLPGNLYYMGEVSNEKVNGALQNSLGLIHTGKPEGFPNIFMQAWSFGKTVISFEYDPDNLIHREGLGSSCQGDLKLFIRRIEEQSIRGKSGSVAPIDESVRRYAEVHFDPEKNIKELEEFLAEFVVPSREPST